jgi:hypothetical protein
MGRAGIEPATLGLKAPVRWLGTSRRAKEKRWKPALSCQLESASFRPVSEAVVITLLTPRAEPVAKDQNELLHSRSGCHGLDLVRER